ncbi:MAG TPA: YciI family protein [Gaiellaceae bacterium]|nr:YciI family protein [Gaiellaceae bacterium]
MKYVALLTNTAEDRARWETMSAEEAAAARAAEMPKWNALFEELGPHLVDGKELEEPATAKTVRVRDGETIVTDGPYAETKEQLGGFFVLDCEDLDQALALATKIPVVERASVELRPVIER